MAQQPMPATRRHRRKTDSDAATLPKRRHDLYYLFAGMGHGSRKRFIRNLICALLVGIAVAAALSGLLYLAYKP
jgi:hypothetical protein